MTEEALVPENLVEENLVEKNLARKNREHSGAGLRIHHLIASELSILARNLPLYGHVQTR